MADRNSRFSVKRKEKKVENQTNDEKDKEKERGKEKVVKKPDKAVKKPEKTPEQPKTDEEKRNGEGGGATGGEAANSEENAEFQPIELPPFEIVTGWVRFNTYTTKVIVTYIRTCFTLEHTQLLVIGVSFCIVIVFHVFMQVLLFPKHVLILISVRKSINDLQLSSLLNQQ